MSYQRRILLYLMAALIIPVLTSCGMAGSRGSMRLDSLAYPVSMSPFLYGPNGEAVAKDQDLKVVGNFRYAKNHWGIFYSVIAVSGTDDMAEAINREIARHHGDGVVNLTITAKSGFMNSVPVLSLLPIWPGYTKLEVQGEIVKLTGENRSPGSN